MTKNCPGILYFSIFNSLMKKWPGLLNLSYKDCTFDFSAEITDIKLKI